MNSPAIVTAIPVAIALLVCGAASAQDEEANPRQARLFPGHFEWEPERSKEGPLLIVVSIDDQVLYLYRNAVQIGRSTVSTGRPGKETPTGVFTVLRKAVDHESNIYKGAKMPFNHRLTWSGVAMHAGSVPGYPDSAGCVRLPYEFSKRLYKITKEGADGTTVVITKRGSAPSKSRKPASLLLATKPDEASVPVPAGKTEWKPDRSVAGPVNLLLSGKDQTLYVYRDGILIGQTPVGIRRPEEPIAGSLFMMLHGEAPGDNPIAPGKPLRSWATLAADPKHKTEGLLEQLQERLGVPPDFARKVYPIMHPGTILFATAEGSTAKTRSKRNFLIFRVSEDAEKK